MITTFENPVNGYRVTVSDRSAFYCTLLFGGFYFLVRCSIRHFVIGLILGIFTFGLSWLFYPFFAARALRTMYYERGYIEVASEPSPSAFPALATVVLLIALVGGGIYLVNNRHSERADGDDPASASPFRSPVVAATPNPAAASRAEALRLYPSLAQKDSALNHAFVELYRNKQATDPVALTNPNWPVALAREAAASLGADIPTAPKAPRWVPSGTALDKRPY